MSILIKGMEMPENCELCMFHGVDAENGCFIEKAFCLMMNGHEKPTWCPLEEVPETHDKRTETHSCDLIDRQAVLNLFPTHDWKHLYDAVKELPSAQRKTKNRRFEEIVVTYPNPDLCSYPEYKGKPYFSIKYEENEEHYIGYGTYNPTVFSMYLKRYFMQSSQPDLQQTCNQLATDCNTHNTLDALDKEKKSVETLLKHDGDAVSNGDVISRQAAIDAIRGADGVVHYWSKQNAIKVLEELPSAQPEIIRCKDCRFNTYSKKCLNPDSFFLVPADDFYCGYAERRTDEQTN